MMNQLTAKQQEIYDYIISFTEQHGYPPSVREIGEAVHLKSPSTVHFHLKGLERAGVITKDAGKTRAISIAPNADGSRRNLVPIAGNVAAGSPILAEQNIEDYL
ncbi:MAG: transcriptional repressor LexA, partial [Oscillospiraceae bacterium]